MRTYDPTVLNRIANLPDVKPYFGHVEEGDIYFDELAPLRDDYILLCNGEDAGAVLEWTGPNIWQGHYLFGPTCRGRKAITEMRRMLDWCFTTGQARIVWGQTPIDNRAARWLNRQVGFLSRGLHMHHIAGACELFWMER